MQRKSWLIALMNDDSLLQLSEGAENSMIPKNFFNSELLKYFRETSRLNLEGMLKRGMTWLCLALFKLNGSHSKIWGKVENNFLGESHSHYRWSMQTYAQNASIFPFLLPKNYSRAGGGIRAILAINQQQREKRGRTAIVSAAHCSLMGESKYQTFCINKRSLQFIDCPFLPQAISSCGNIKRRGSIS